MLQSEKIELVKKIPIQKYFDDIIVPNMEDYYSGSLVDFDVKNVVKCPLHNEDTPSLRYYSETNTFYCWGCQRGGDIIDLHREFCSIALNNQYTFEGTIDFLFKRYIENRNTELVTARKKIVQVIENSEKDLYKFNRRWLKVESQMQVDTDLTFDQKVVYYNRMDQIHCLVYLNKLSVTDALELMQNIGKENIWNG